MKIKIKSVNLVSSWTWKGPEEVCGICHLELDSSATDGQFPGDDAPAISGKCNHTFHLNCIMKWLETQDQEQTCPMCRSAWEFEETN
eukprot:gene4400-7775_t